MFGAGTILGMVLGAVVPQPFEQMRAAISALVSSRPLTRTVSAAETHL